MHLPVSHCPPTQEVIFDMIKRAVDGNGDVKQKAAALQLALKTFAVVHPGAFS